MKFNAPTIIFKLLFVFLIASKAIANMDALDVTTNFCKHYDFSSLLMPQSDFLGFIAPNYQKLDIKFVLIYKSATNSCLYFVKGKSTVKNNSCNFLGTIKIDKIKRFSSIDYGIDEEYKNKGLKSEGEVQSTYYFEENKDQKFSGVFRGKMLLYWYVDKNGKIVYDNINFYSDSYSNNQYTGTWTEYGKTSSKIANWGEYRIPNSGDLDIGTGEFVPNPKYKNQGW